MVESPLPIPEPRPRELVPSSETEESQLIKIALNEPDPLERARKIASLRGASGDFEALLEQNPASYRSTPDLSALVLRAIDTRKDALEQRIELTEKQEITRWNIAKEYFTTYIGGIAKGIYTGIKESLKTVILPLLPGKLQVLIEEKSAEKGQRRALYNTLSVIYDTTAIGTAYFTLIPKLLIIADYDGFYFLGGILIALSGVANGISRLGQQGTWGPLISEAAFYPMRMLQQGVSHLNGQARKNLEEKKRLLLTEYKEE